MQPLKQSRAWQPFTPRGVAGFARGPLKRLLLVQSFFAALAAVAMVWFFDTAWFPAIERAIRQLPARGEIRSGALNWSGESPQLLAEDPFVAFSVDLTRTGRIRPAAHVQVEFGARAVRILSLFGYLDWPYPGDDWIVGFNRNELEPWWGAWESPLLWLTFAAVVLALPGLWTLLATLWCLPVWLVGFFANRDLRIWASWKLAGAAWLPGTLLLTTAVFLYGLRVLDLVQLVAAGITHFVLGGMYCLLSPFFAPHLATAVKGNPFAGP